MTPIGLHGSSSDARSASQANEKTLQGPGSASAVTVVSSGDGTNKQSNPSTHFAGMHGSSDPEALAASVLAYQQARFVGGGAPRFELDGVLGVGGQGTVYCLHDHDSGRDLAFKALHGNKDDTERIARFVHEAQVTAQLEHPGIVPVHDMGVLDDGTVYYTMKRIDGDSLADRIAEFQKDDGARFSALQVLLKVCDAVGFAHEHGVLHRDLKPRNIMLGNHGEVLVVDWGLAKILNSGSVDSLRSPERDDSDAFATQDGYAVGTPSYMSPEQARGEGAALNPRSDVFSRGVILYEILCGKSPYFPERSARKTLLNAAEGRWKPLSECSALRVPKALLAVVEKAMTFAPEQRYQTVSDLVDDIRSFLAGKSIVAYAESPLERALRFAKRYRVPIYAGASIALVSVCILLTLSWLEHERQEERVNDLRRGAAVSLAQGDLNAAIVGYERILEYYPNDIQAIESVVDLRAEQKQRAEIAAARAADEERREQASALIKEAQRYAQAGDDAGIDRALELLTQSLAVIPVTDDAGLRAIALRDRDLLSARRNDQVTRARQQRAAIKLQLAEEHSQRGEWLSASAALGLAMDLIPANDQTKALAKRIRDGLDQQKQAQQQQTAVELLHEARTLREQRKYGAAVSKTEAALALHPSDAATQLLAELLRKRDQAERQAAYVALQSAFTEQYLKFVAAIAEQNETLAQDLLVKIRDISDRIADPEVQRSVSAADTQLKSLQRQLAERQAAVELARVGEISQQLKDLVLEHQQTQKELDELHVQLSTGVKNPVVRSSIHELLIEKQRVDTDILAAVDDAIGSLHRARTVAPHFQRIRQVSADFWAMRVRQLDNLRDHVGAAAAAAQGKHFDTEQRYRLLFAGYGVLRSRLMQNATVFAIERQRDGRELPQETGKVLSPGKELELVAGQYAMQVPDGRVFTLNLQRGETYNFDLPPFKNLPRHVRYIPAASLSTGEQTAAFAIAQYEVTCGDYLEFLNDPTTLKTIDAHDGLPILAPRARWDSAEHLWLRERGQFVLRYATKEQQPILAEAPVTGITISDVRAYINWRRERDGLDWRLPTDSEWRAAVEAGCERPFPWGSLADTQLCASGSSHSGNQGAYAVGLFAGDRSLHGVADLAGGVAEFVEAQWPRRPGFAVYCGGSYLDAEPRLFSADAKRAMDPRLLWPGVGFRLALDVAAE